MTDVYLHWIEVPDRGHDELLARVLPMLSESEAARADRFRFERDRVLFATAHAFLRTILTRYTGAQPAFVESDHGKPELADRAVRFNLSHTRGVVLAGVTTTADLGVDVERMGERDLQSLAARVFNERERATWDGTPEWFFERWTLKEAYLKARGVGLSLDLQAIGLEAERAQWQFRTFAPTPAHRAAAAVRSATAVRWITRREEFP